MKVVTAFDHPPVPCRRFDWSAYLAGEEEHGPVGHGETEAAALRDLCAQLATLYYESQEA